MKIKQNLTIPCIILVSIFILPSCYVVKKNILINDSIVLNNKIISKHGNQDIKKKLFIDQLGQIVPDTLRNKAINFLGLIFFVKKFGVLDTNIITQVKNIMEQQLLYNGYYHSSVNHEIQKKYIRARGKKTLVNNIIYYIDVGRKKKITDLKVDIKDSILASVVEEALQKQTINEGTDFSLELIEKFQNAVSYSMNDKGYINFNAQDLHVLIDTFGKNTTKIIFINKTLNDSNIKKQYLVRKVYFINENKESVNISSADIKKENYKDITLLQKTIEINPKLIWICNELQKNQVLRISDISSTLRKYYSTNTWKFVSVDNKFVKDTIIHDKNYSYYDIYFKSKMLKKYKLTFTVGLNYNAPAPWTNINLSPFIISRTTSTSLNVLYEIRNLFKRGITLLTSAQLGVELSLTSNIFPTIDYGFNTSAEIPGLLFLNRYKTKFQKNTILNSTFTFGFLNTDRVLFYNFRSINTSFGWRLSKKKLVSIQYRPVAFTINFLNKYDSFLSIERNNPFLSLIFNQGITGGMELVYSKKFLYKNLRHFSTFSISAEESNLTWAKLAFMNNDMVFTYVKTTANFVHTIKYRKNILVFRAIGGIGASLNDDYSISRNTLPFFKQFFAGGTNSLRAWVIGEVGLGSEARSDLSSLQDRRGDIYIEANVEDRFFILDNPKSFRIEGAVFSDIGNIWNRVGGAANTLFRINRLYEDLAIASGLGLRFVVGDFLIFRFDYAWKIKDPIYNNTDAPSWFNPNNIKPFAGRLQFGLGYPF